MTGLNQLVCLSLCKAAVLTTAQSCIHMLAKITSSRITVLTNRMTVLKKFKEDKKVNWQHMIKAVTNQSFSVIWRMDTWFREPSCTSGHSDVRCLTVKLVHQNSTFTWSVCRCCQKSLFLSVTGNIFISVASCCGFLYSAWLQEKGTNPFSPKHSEPVESANQRDAIVVGCTSAYYKSATLVPASIISL